MENFDARQRIHVSDLSSGTQCAATALCLGLFPPLEINQMKMIIDRFYELQFLY